MLSESLLVNKIKYYASLPWLTLNQRVFQYQNLLKTEIILDYELHIEDTQKANYYTRSINGDQESIIFRQQQYQNTFAQQSYKINSSNQAQIKIILSKPQLYVSEIILITYSNGKSLLYVYFDCTGIKQLKFAKEQLINYHSLKIRDLFIKLEEEFIPKHQSIFNLNDTTDYVSTEKDQRYYADHYRLQELDMEEADIYYKLHEKLQNHKLNSNTLIRFLCARRYLNIISRFDLDATYEMITNWIKWRKDNHIYRLFSKDYSEFEIFKVIGQSREGRPVIYTKQSKLFPSKMYDISQIRNQDRYAQYFIAFLEDTLRSCKGMVDSYVTVLDVEGFGYSNFDMQLTKRLLSMVLQYFPERQNKVFIINISFVVMGIYKTLKPFLPVRTNDKLVFIGKDDNEIKRVLTEDLGELINYGQIQG